MPILSFRQRTTIFAVTLICSLGLAACDKKNKEDPAATAKAEEVWKTRCVTCHGATGTGNGPGAAALTPKPRSFADPTWQASVDDARISKVILEGGAAVGLSGLMVPNPDLATDPAALAALVKKIRKMVK